MYGYGYGLTATEIAAAGGSGSGVAVDPTPTYTPVTTEPIVVGTDGVVEDPAAVPAGGVELGIDGVPYDTTAWQSWEFGFDTPAPRELMDADHRKERRKAMVQRLRAARARAQRQPAPSGPSPLLLLGVAAVAYFFATRKGA
jgi:hypothetical protein